MDEKDIIKLENIGVTDSKLLSEKQRELISEEIKKIADYKIIKVEPWEIDEAVEGKDGLNLNWLEARKIAEIINELNPDIAYIDCPSPNIKSYSDYLSKLLKKPIKLVVEHKSDFKYTVVGAASILAKVIREEEIKKIEEKIGESVGTGYPSNPICQEFLKRNWDKYPNIFRKSWISWKNHKIAKEQKRIEDFE